MKRRMLFVVLAIAASLFSVTAFADDIKFGALTIKNAWARPSIGARGNSAAYVTIENAGDEADRLISASTPLADKVELHNSLREGGIVRMRPVEGGITVPAHGTIALKPGGTHIMLMQLKEPLKMDDLLPLILTFEIAGSVTVDAGIQMKPGMAGHMHGDMKGREQK